MQHGSAGHTTAASGAPRPRAAWVDCAKGISICLVVLWHAVGTAFLVNNLLILVRMPLFFFLAGFFAAKIIATPWPHLLRTRTLNFYYIYLVWMTLFFILVVTVREAVHGHLPSPATYLIHLVVPLDYLWFLFTLALLFAFARLVRGIPAAAVIGALLLVYAVSVSDGRWEPITYATRLARLPLFFMLGTLSFAQVDAWSRASRAFWPLSAALFAGASLMVMEGGLGHVAAATLATSALGILAVCQFCQQMQATALGRGLAFLGRRTLHIYLIHAIAIAYLVNGLQLLGWSGVPARLAVFAAALAVSVVAGEILARRTPWLFAAPWLARAGTASVRPG